MTQPQPALIRYQVDIDDLHSHHFRVTLTVAQPAAEQRVSLPVWINGSYMVREFGRHLSGLSARQGLRPLTPQQLDKTSWQLRCSGKAALVLSYRVYAFDASVRAAFLDVDRGFFNGSSLCLRVHGREVERHRLQLGALPRGWQLATAMGAAPDGAARAFEAADYNELVDHPVTLGRFWSGGFDAGGVPHEIVVSGALPGFDGERLLADSQRICAQQIDFWHGDDDSKPPFDRYQFHLHAAEDGFGGLEHRASAALTAARRDLPRQHAAGLSDGYVTLLSLISHEYFHSWNVKRLKPDELVAPAHDRENYTRLLWFFEGITSYYDELMLRRAGLIDAPRYLRLLAKTLNAVAQTPGRQVQSVAEASFDAWVKYYRGDENTANATVSYYLKGALLALCLDLRLRRLGSSLDELMRRLWQRSGAGPTAPAEAGAIREDDIVAELAALGGRAMAAELRAWVHGTGELPVVKLLPDFAVSPSAEHAPWALALGLKLSEGPLTGVRVGTVLAGGAAAAAGLSAGDELLAIDDWRIRRLDDAQAWLSREQPFELLLVRDQRVMRLKLVPQPLSPLASQWALHCQDKPNPAARRRRLGWLDA